MWPSAQEAFKRFRDAQILLRAAALAYHSVLGIIPSFGVVFWYLSSIHVLDRWVLRTKHFMLRRLSVDSSAIFIEHFERLTEKVSGHSWGWVGFIILLYTVWSLISRFGESLDFILKTGTERAKTRGRGVLAARRVLVVMGMPLALALSLGVSEWIRKDSLINFVFKLPTLGGLLALPFTWVGTIVSLALVYHIVPRVFVPWREAVRAALIVGPLSEMVRHVFRFYSHYSVATQKIYGVLAVIPLFILWIQIGWILVLSGALLIRHPHSQVS